MKRVGLLLSILIVLSIFQFAFAIAESGSGPDGDSGEKSGSDSKDESETKIEVKDGRIKVEEKSRIGDVKKEIKTEIRADRIREEIKEENGEFKREIKQEIREIIEDERERKILEFRMRIKERNGTILIDDRAIVVKEISEQDKEIIAGRINAKTGLNITAEDIGNGSRGEILRAYLSNGRHADIRILPDRAAEVAALRIGARCEETNCSVVLKEVGQGNESEARYEIETEKEARAFGIFKARMRIQAHVNPETGEVILVRKPWWAFLANEPEISDDVESDESDMENETEIEIDNQTVESDIETNVSVNSS